MCLHNYSETPCVLLNWEFYKLAHYICILLLCLWSCLENKTCLVMNVLNTKLVWFKICFWHSGLSECDHHLSLCTWLSASSEMLQWLLRVSCTLVKFCFLYNNICAMCYFSPIKPWSVKENVSLSFNRVQAFLNSDQNRCATKLLSAYEEGDAEEIKRISQSSAFNHLDHVVIIFISSIKSNACWIVSAME